MDMDSDKILECLGGHHDGKFGFVVYRCAYGNQEQWDHFITRLTEYVDVNLEIAPEDLRRSFHWIIMDDEEQYKNATKDEIRSAFVEWRKPLQAQKDLTEYVACIFVDQEVIDAVISGEDPCTDNEEQITNSRAYVKLVRYRLSIPPGGADQGCDPVEGCTLVDVGWMKVAAMSLVPRAYSMLMENGWTTFYERPPTIWDK